MTVATTPDAIGEIDGQIVLSWPMHQPENVGDEPFELVLVELEAKLASGQ